MVDHPAVFEDEVVHFQMKIWKVGHKGTRDTADGRAADRGRRLIYVERAIFRKAGGNVIRNMARPRFAIALGEIAQLNWIEFHCGFFP